jgi:hypothetical protein
MREGNTVGHMEYSFNRRCLAPGVGAPSAMREEFLRIATEVAAKRTEGKVWPPAEITTVLVVSSTIELVALWLRPKKPLSVEAMAEIHERMIRHQRGARGLAPGCTQICERRASNCWCLSAPEDARTT